MLKIKREMASRLSKSKTCQIALCSLSTGKLRPRLGHKLHHQGPAHTSVSLLANATIAPGAPPPASPAIRPRDGHHDPVAFHFRRCRHGINHHLSVCAIRSEPSSGFHVGFVGDSAATSGQPPGLFRQFFDVVAGRQGHDLVFFRACAE